MDLFIINFSVQIQSDRSSYRENKVCLFLKIPFLTYLNIFEASLQRAFNPRPHFHTNLIRERKLVTWTVKLCSPNYSAFHRRKSNIKYMFVTRWMIWWNHNTTVFSFKVHLHILLVYVEINLRLILKNPKQCQCCCCWLPVVR